MDELIKLLMQRYGMNFDTAHNAVRQTTSGDNLERARQQYLMDNSPAMWNQPASATPDTHGSRAAGGYKQFLQERDRVYPTENPQQDQTDQDKYDQLLKMGVPQADAQSLVNKMRNGQTAPTQAYQESMPTDYAIPQDVLHDAARSVAQQVVNPKYRYMPTQMQSVQVTQ